LKRLLVAVMFLTRIPGPRAWAVGAVEVGHSAAFFPLVGAAVGAVQWCLLWASLGIAGHAKHLFGRPIALPTYVLSILITAAGVWLTGALHLDGVADMADGFGGGRTREDVLRIMRDHLIGSFGAVALILVLALKFASITVLIDRGTALPYLIIAPGLARGSMVELGFFLPYARSVEGGLGGSFQYVGRLELLLSSGAAIALAFLAGWRCGSACVLVTLLASAWTARICMRRIGGITGDTLGANSEVCEALILATGAILSS
jgi:adenosylcobinamide-GDP ribazoletransferase